MATWEEVRGFINGKYKVNEDIGRGLALRFELNGGRSQMVLITCYDMFDGREEWILIESPFGALGEVDLARAVQLVGDKVVGGLAVTTDLGEPQVTVRHAVPLMNLDANELEAPLMLVTVTADELEHALSGSSDIY
jgi:hypothetical protein